MHVLIYKQLKRAGISTNRIIKHIWESDVQRHVASSPRNMRNAEPARMPRECLPTPENVVPWNAAKGRRNWTHFDHSQDTNIAPFLFTPSYPDCTQRRFTCAASHHWTKKAQAVNFLLHQSLSLQNNVDTTISFHNCHSTHSGQAHARPSLEKLLHLAFAAETTSLFPF